MTGDLNIADRTTRIAAGLVFMLLFLPLFLLLALCPVARARIGHGRVVPLATAWRARARPPGR